MIDQRIICRLKQWPLLHALPAIVNSTPQPATAVKHHKLYKMKKLTRDDLKKVMGGYNAPGGGCGEYEGQTTFICGTRTNAGTCYIDICLCNGTPVGCNIASEDYSDCQ